MQYRQADELKQVLQLGMSPEQLKHLKLTESYI